ncbi:hypothetical protein HN873_039401 [Arachis hypogaea]
MYGLCNGWMCNRNSLLWSPEEQSYFFGLMLRLNRTFDISPLIRDLRALQENPH